MFNIAKYKKIVSSLNPVEKRGRITKLVGLILEASIEDVKIGEICEIKSIENNVNVKVEVVGFVDKKVILMPLGNVAGISLGAEVVSTGTSLLLKINDNILGRVLNGLGEFIDDKKGLEQTEIVQVSKDPPGVLNRKRISRHFETGIRAIDGLLTIGEGQRMGIFAAAGVGKSTLLGMLARNTEAEVNVIALIGERGREVLEFIERDLGTEGLKRSVIIVSTSNEPSLIRFKAAYVATAIAEYFRDKGKKVLFMMDSVTRFARALREVGLSAGEPPARAGFPPSVFSELPKLLEITGNSQNGSITAFYTVLVEGDDMNEPIADETRSILDGHIVLSRELASSGHYPAIDINNSISRVMSDIIDPTHRDSANKFRDILATYESQKDLIMIGAYKYGSDRRTDYAIANIEKTRQYLQQSGRDSTQFQDSIRLLETFIQ